MQVYVIPIDYFGQDLNTVEEGTPFMTAGYDYRRDTATSAFGVIGD